MSRISSNCGLRGSRDAAMMPDSLGSDKENVDANAQRSSASSATGIAVGSKRTRGVAPSGGARRNAKRKKPAASSALAEVASNPPAAVVSGAQETPPPFTFTRGKQPLRKRKQRAELRKQQSDQKRLDELAQYFKNVDAKELAFGVSE